MANNKSFHNTNKQAQSIIEFLKYKGVSMSSADEAIVLSVLKTELAIAKQQGKIEAMEQVLEKLTD